MLVGIGIAIMQNWSDGGMYAVVGVVALVVFFGIGYVLSSGDVPEKLASKGFSDPGTYKLVGAGIMTFYILALVAAILLVVDIVKGFMDGN